MSRFFLSTCVSINRILGKRMADVRTYPKDDIYTLIDWSKFLKVIAYILFHLFS